MGMIINIDQALSQHATYNILKEPLNKMLSDMQEAWERQNPIDLLFTRGTINRFQETYTSTIGFSHVLSETADYTVAPIFNTADGFTATYTSRTFQGGFVITQQVLEDGEMRVAKDTATQFMTRWHGDIVEYAMTAISAGFGYEKTYGEGEFKSRLKLNSADTTDGDIMTATKNPLFSNKHTIVKRPGMDAAAVSAAHQSNLFYANIDVVGEDPERIHKLADVINQVITIMENYKDDNNKRAGVLGAKTIVTSNNAHLKAALNAALTMPDFGPCGPNVAFNRATLETTPYLLDIPQCAVDKNGVGQGFFIVDRAYNAANHGPELTERIAMTMNVEQKKNPYGVAYDARERFDINVASWRGIAYVYLGKPAGSDWDTVTNFTEITPIATTVKPVTIVGEVTTKTSA